MTNLRSTKPRVWFDPRSRKWICNIYGVLHSYYTVGYGATPIEAFNDWKAGNGK